jgi:hypothetical protein
MDPLMWAALIGVGGSVIVALVGFFTTQHISVMSMRASMTKAHNDRIWDKRAVAYERALAEVANRQVRRERAMLLGPDTMSAAKRLEAYFAVRDKPEWSEAEGQLMAYSTPCVWDALKDARGAERTAAGVFDDDLAWGPCMKLQTWRKPATTLLRTGLSTSSSLPRSSERRMGCQTATS